MNNEHNNAPAVPQGWVKASDRMPLDGYSDGLREIADELDAVQKDLAGIELQADGNANFYWLMRDGKWIAKIQMNGEMLVDKQVALLEAMLSAGTQIAHCPKCFTCFEVGSGSTEQNPWRDAVIEQLESWHICVPAIHDNSPRLAIKALVNIETKAALDPAVSSEAAALVAGQHNNAPAVPQGYEIHEIPADYSGLVWLEGQVRAVARRAQAATGPQRWTDADSDAARLALELECLLMDTKDLSVVSKWWDSANDALELHRQRLAATPSPAPAQGEPFGYFRAEPFGWTDCAATDEGAIALYEHPAKPAQEVGLTGYIPLLEEVASSLEDYKNDAPWGSWDRERLERLYAIIAALRAKGGK